MPRKGKARSTPPPNAFGQRLKLARKYTARRSSDLEEMTQGEVGKAVGVAQGTISDWEQGRSVPRLPMIEELARVLGVPASFLLLGKDDMPPGALAPPFNQAGPIVRSGLDRRRRSE